MAKITDTNLMWFGSRGNVKQMRLAIPGGSTANTGGISFLECIDSGGLPQGGLYLFTDGTNLRYSTSVPTNTNTDGDPLDATAVSAMVNKQLSNLGTVAINTSIQSDTNLTDDLGTSAPKYWKALYARDLYLNSTATIKGTSAGQIDVVGTMTFGADGADTADVVFYGETATEYMIWDGNAYDTASSAALLLKDNVYLGFGAQAAAVADITFVWDETDLAIEPQTGSLVVRSGAAADLDWIWESATGAGKDMGWVADIFTLQLADDTILQIGGSAIDTVTDGFQIIFDGTKTLNINPVGAHTSDVVRIGQSVIADFYLDGNAYDIYWDASVDEFVFRDGAKLVFGGDGTEGADDLVIASDGTLAYFTMPATDSGMVIQPYAAATVAALHIDGASNDWNGAPEVGMLHISSDTALGNAAAANLLVTHATDQPIDNADGFLARFVSTGTARTNAYALDVVVTATQPAMRLNSTVEITGVNNTANVLKLTGVDLGGNTDTVLIDHSGDGYAINIDLNEATSDGINVEAFTDHTVPLIRLDGDTAGFLGASNIGMLTIQNDIALTDVASSALVIDVGTTAPKNSAEGYCFRIIDTSTVAQTPPAYAAYIDATANEGMGIETRAAAAKNLTLLGVEAQTDSMLYVDGTTGTGWDGANDTGMVHIETLIQHHVGATCLLVETEVAPIAQAEGACARFIQTGGNAVTDGYLVQIEAVTLGGALHVDTGYVTFDEALTVGTTLGVTGAATFTAGQQSAAVARTATSEGGTDGLIADGTTYVTVTSTDAARIIKLPTPTPGNVVWMAVTDTGFELKSSASSSVKINGGSGATASSSVSTDVLVRAVCTSATTWIASQFSTNGTESKLEAATS